VHDYLVAWNSGTLARWVPDWASQRIFLLHYGADLMLLGMGGLLAARFIHALSSLEAVNTTLADLNETLELRVAERERHLQANFERLGVLQREHAAAQERTLIMREIHDGLGSRLFSSLLRVERGDMSHQQIADALRDCIADMRLALEVLSPDDDFQAALGNFLFRWQTQLQEAHVQPAWAIEVPDGALQLPRQAALQLLRIAQEALTNVLKHARATTVRIDLRQRGDQLELEVADDGRGADTPIGRPGGPANHTPGRGIGNMRARARQLGGELELRSGVGGTRVLLRLPLARREGERRPLV
jgi:signal transduction histidine kinase